MRCFVLLLILATGCVTPRQSEWQLQDAGQFTFLLPSDMHKTKLRGIDSYVSEFKGRDMTISFDYGMWSNDFSDWPASTDFEVVSIDGLPAKIGLAHEGFHYRFPYATQVYFKDTVHPKGGFHLSMFASCRTLEDCARAKRVFYSIKFKSEPR